MKLTSSSFDLGQGRFLWSHLSCSFNGGKSHLRPRELKKEGRQKGSTQSGADPQAVSAPGGRNRRRGAREVAPGCPSSERRAATGERLGEAGVGSEEGSSAGVCRLLPRSGRPLLFSDSSGLAPPAHIPNSRRQLVAHFRSPGLLSVPPTLLSPTSFVYFCI